jgi:hypothetical protein
MVCSSFTFAHYTSLEKLARDKNSSLFGLLLMPKKKYYGTDTGSQWYDTLFSDTDEEKKRLERLSLASQSLVPI